MKSMLKDTEEKAICICGDSKTDSAKVVTARDQDFGGLHHFLQCVACGTYRVSPRPNVEAIGGFYPKTYRNHSPGQSPLNSKLLNLKLQIYQDWWAPKGDKNPASVVAKIFTLPIRTKTPLAFVPPNLRSVFEIGAATGLDLLLFKQAGWKVAGCELSEQAVAVAKSYGLDVFQSSAEALSLPSETYGCIHLNNVFEHLHEPKVVLEKAAAALVKGGKIVIVVPNHRSIGAKLFGAAWPGFDGPRHLWGFTTEGISQALTQTGFMVEDIQHLPSGRWSWYDCWIGARREHAKPPMNGKIASLLATLMLPLGVIAAFFEKGDTFRVVAVKI